MNSDNFSIKEFEGINFAKLSGDNNIIHVDKIAGYNSVYGHNIVHGVLIILKFLNKIKFRKNYSHIKVLFTRAFRYNSKIKIRKIKENISKISYELIQQNNINANIEIGFSQEQHIIQSLKKVTFKKKYLISKKIRRKFSGGYVPVELKIALCYLSKYVGTVYPGKNSAISEINIFNNNINTINEISINLKSSLLTKGFPLIDNRLIYKNYYIEFKTLIRPKLNIILNKLNKEILKETNLIKENILIIGGSSGIGNDLLKLFLNNKKIKIIGTYYKNKINDNRKNLIVKKLNIETDLVVIYKIIKKYEPIIIYYFPTPKIFFNSINDKNLIELYKKYFVHIPIKIIKYASNFQSKFFYPSTTYNNTLSPYSSIKLEAENEISKLKKLKTKINILRIPGVNTKQNLSLLSKKLPNFRDLISRDKKILNKVFFKNYIFIKK